VNKNELLGVLEARGAVQRGHFRLSSGRHSDVYVQKFRVFEHPGLTQSLGASIGAQFGDFDLVASPAVGAVLLGFATALAAGTPMVFSERVDGEMVFRRGFQIPPRARTLVVEDVITTGGSAREVCELVRRGSGEVVGVGALLDRSARGADLGFSAPLKALLRLDAESWTEADCPYCARSEPLSDPGSRRL
jgi:orotate phosphoribosyltransferase